MRTELSTLGRGNIPLIKTAVAVCIILCALIATGLRNGHYATPLALWTDAVQKSPLKRRVHLNLGHVLSEAGIFSQASYELDLARRMPDDGTTPLSSVYREVSDMYLRMGRYQDAVTEGLKGLQLSPNDARLLGNVGLGFVRLQQFERALMYAEASYAAHRSPEALTLLGEVHLAKGNAAQAAEHYVAAITLSPEVAFRYWNAAVALTRAGRYDEARRYLTIYMAQEMDSERRKMALDLMGTLQQQR